MTAHLLIERPGAEPERRALAGPLRAGGSHADDVLLPGCPPGALRLVPCPAGAVVEAIACGVRVGGHAVAPGTRRLLRPGERAELHGAALAVESAPAGAEGTRAGAALLLGEAASGADPGRGLHLLVLSGPAAGTRLALAAEQVLGRGRRADLLLPDPRASRLHARVRLSPAGASVEDLGSKNGVRVNGVPIERGPFPLRPGDELTVGDTALALADGAAPGPGRARRPPRFPGALVAAALLALSAAALALAAG